MTEAIETTDETTCTACMTVPISHLALEVEVPLSGSWQRVFDELEIKVLTDPAGRPAITTSSARKLFAAIKRRGEVFTENSQRRVDELAARRPPVRAGGVPMVEGMTPFESLAAAGGGVVSPSQEFSSGREKPNFLADELQASARDQAEKQREAAARAKQRLADQAKDKLR